MRLGPSHKMDPGELCDAFRIDRIGHVPDEVVEGDIAVRDSRYVDKLSQQAEHRLRRGQ